MQPKFGHYSRDVKSQPGRQRVKRSSFVTKQIEMQLPKDIQQQERKVVCPSQPQTTRVKKGKYAKTSESRDEQHKTFEQLKRIKIKQREAYFESLYKNFRKHTERMSRSQQRQQDRSQDFGDLVIDQLDKNDPEYLVKKWSNQSL